MKLGSLFDGSGGFPLAASFFGIKTEWTSEIEAFPLAVSHKHFPDALQLGDVTKIDGGKIPFVDIITFGSPCQDMSLAGERKGLKHDDKGDSETTRSGLFFEAIRIIKEMLDASNGRYPRYAIWENVFGAFSSCNGNDFRCVLEAFLNVKEKGISVPSVKVWPYAGEILGQRSSLAYRLFDAQFWGVPQRRRRIYLIADFGGMRAPEILFDAESSHGNAETCERKGQGIASNTEESFGKSSLPMMFENHANDSRVKGPVDVAETVSARYGTGGGNTPIILSACKNSFFATASVNLANTLAATDYKAPPIVATDADFKVRRLTPTECARLQGFPDDWAKGVEGYTDAKEYKLWGNGIALPCAKYIFRKMTEAENEAVQR